MKLLYIVIVLVICLGYGTAGAADEKKAASTELMAKQLSDQCNMGARNSLASGDIEVAEEACMKAIEEIDKSYEDKRLLINPLMNLAFSYTLAGQFDKATPYYDRARSITIQLDGPDSKMASKIDQLINAQEEMKRHQGE